LRGGEWIMGVASVLLLIDLFTTWYGFKGVYAPTAASLQIATHVSGWNSLIYIRLLILLAGFCGAVAALLQAVLRSPAWPVSVTVFGGLFSFLTFLGLIFRVLIDPPGNHQFVEPKFGAYAGLVLSAALLIGIYLSLREDGVAEFDAPQSIETLRLTQRPRPAASAR
jgi:hypothetical protein